MSPAEFRRSPRAFSRSQGVKWSPKFKGRQPPRKKPRKGLFLCLRGACREAARATKAGYIARRIDEPGHAAGESDRAGGEQPRGAARKRSDARSEAARLPAAIESSQPKRVGCVAERRQERSEAPAPRAGGSSSFLLESHPAPPPPPSVSAPRDLSAKGAAPHMNMGRRPERGAASIAATEPRGLFARLSCGLCF